MSRNEIDWLNRLAGWVMVAAVLLAVVLTMVEP
jgi:hypothetical protein